MSRVNAKGRNKWTPHVRLDHIVFDCPAYRALSVNARALLWELIRLFNGRNNGAIYLSIRDAERLLGLGSDAAITNAFRELQEHGLIRCVEKGGFNRKVAHASTWALCWLSVHDQPPTREFQSWQPVTGSKAARRLAALANCNVRSLNQRLAVPIFAAAAETHGNEPTGPVPESGTANLKSPESDRDDPIPESGAHIIYHGKAGRLASESECNCARALIRKWLSEAGRSNSQRELARKSGLSEATVSRFLRQDQKRLSRPEIHQLIRATFKLLAPAVEQRHV
jgi:hypothetical protein